MSQVESVDDAVKRIRDEYNQECAKLLKTPERYAEEAPRLFNLYRTKLKLVAPHLVEKEWWER